MRKVLVASDSFKGTLDALNVGLAFERGWRRVSPDDDIDVLPIADGGEGTLDAIHHAVPDSVFVTVPSVDPQGAHRNTRWLALPDGTGVVELAETCGLGLTDPLQPMAAHTTEFGRVIAHALDSGVSQLLLAIGGSASTDGGVGMLTALGARFSDAHGRAIRSGGAGLGDLHEADLSGLRALPFGGVTVLSDVASPLIGEEGAANVFGPQKGATDVMVRELDHGLARLAEVTGHDPLTPGAGAAGGTGFALQLWGAHTRSGARGIAELLNLEDRIARSDIVVTGEGAYDAQTSEGKLPSHVLRVANDHGVFAMLIAGAILAEPVGFAHAISLTRLAGSRERAMAEPEKWIETAGTQCARVVSSDHQAGRTRDTS